MQLDHETSARKRQQSEYREYLQKQQHDNHRAGQSPRERELPRPKDRTQPNSPKDGYMVPGIHNLPSVGSSPMRRIALWQVQPRDLAYQVEGAGQTSSKLNARY